MIHSRWPLHSHPWPLLLAFLGLGVILPGIYLFKSWLSPSLQYWQHLIATDLITVFLQSITLTLCVTITTIVVGTTLALITTFLSFPGQTIAHYLCLVPIAIPSYVMGFIWLSWFEYNAPIQQGWRYLSGNDTAFWDITGLNGLVLSMTFSLFPYVYIMVRLSLQALDGRLLEASYSMGCSFWSTLRRVLLPTLVPVFLGAGILVAMETLSDFGTVSVYSYHTLTTAIFKAWFGFFDLSAALQMACLLLVVSWILCGILTLIRSRYSQGQGHVFQTEDFEAIKAQRFPQPYPVLIALGVFAFLGLVVISPLVSLVVLASDAEVRTLWSYVWPHVYDSMLVATIAAIGVVAIAALGLFWIREHTLIRPGKAWIRGALQCYRLLNFGYAIPPAVLGVSLFALIAHFDHWELFHFPLTGTLSFLIGALMVHFFAVGYQVLSSRYLRLPTELDEASHNLQCQGLSLFRRLHAPLLKCPLLFAWLMVFVDVIKEMPLTLMLRPDGTDTLSVKVYEWIHEGEWEKAAIPSCIIVGMSMLVLSLLFTYRFSAAPTSSTTSHSLHIESPL